ncbi:Signal peptide peptidase family protein [Leishmania donovani]|uniref:Signal peptide peptidase family protein n=1 Tax=Leishmania donovani TaxID=5661 RepID=A0A504XP98_LEIDO|nr:Signal peptide peptidase family protein [Leishmania donovani]
MPQVYIALTFLATCAITAVAVGALRCRKVMMKGKSDIALQTDEALSMPLNGSVMLFSLYVSLRFIPKEYFNILISFYLSLISVFALHMLVKGYIKPNIVTGLICVGTGCASFFAQNWIASNILAFSIAVTALERLPVNGFTTSFILLIGLFFYDIFWVFGSDVMLMVATGIDGPIKLVFPQTIFGDCSKKSLLGLGDIIVPGLFICQTLVFSKDYVRRGSLYFATSMVAYTLSLVNTMAVMLIFQHGQPALLFIVPWLLVTFSAVAVYNGDVKAAWSFDILSVAKSTAKVSSASAQRVAKKPPSKVKYYMGIAYEGLRHVYHGFRLFFINTRLAWKYSRQLKKGVALTRRERLLLESSTKDLLRLVPFSFFIMFPGLIPSTFESESQGRNRLYGDAMKTLRARQRAMDYLSATALATFDKEQQEVIRRAVMGDSIAPKDIRLVAPYFGRDGPFSVFKVPDNIVVGLGRSVGVYKWYHSLLPTRVLSPIMRRSIIRRYHEAREDDRLIRLEGLDGMNNDELVKANQTRGMRWTEGTETLRVQLEWWNSLAQDDSVPYNTLWWIKPTRYSIRKSMNNLPVEQRRQLLGIQNLPETVRASLETLCETVDTMSSISDEPNSADKLVEKIEKITSSAEKSDSDIGFEGLQEAVGAYLTEENVKRMFEKLSKKKLPEESVVVSDVIECIGQETHNSSHVVSTVFDAFDYGAGSKPITEKALLGIGARCRKAVRPPPAPKAAEEKPKSTSTEEKSIEAAPPGKR